MKYSIAILIITLGLSSVKLMLSQTTHSIPTKYHTLNITSFPYRQLNDIDINLTTADNYYFVGTIRAGQNFTSYNFLFDTGSTVTWLPSESCDSCHVSTRFKCGTSCSISQNVATFNYWNNAQVTGNITTDSFQMADDTFINGMQFITATNETGLLGLKSDGICGLNYQSMIGPGSYGLMYYLNAQSLITNPMIGLYYSSSKIPSHLMFGGYDSSIAKSIEWISNCDSKYWEISINKFTLGGDLYNGSGNTAIIDSGIPHLIVPRAVFVNYIISLEKKFTTCGISYAHNLFSCYMNKIEDGEKFPDITLQFQTGNYTIEGSKLCQAYNETSSTVLGVLLLEVWDNNTWVLGSNFLLDHYAIFSFTNASIGFSTIEYDINIRSSAFEFTFSALIACLLIIVL